MIQKSILFYFYIFIYQRKYYKIYTLINSYCQDKKNQEQQNKLDKIHFRNNQYVLSEVAYRIAFRVKYDVTNPVSAILSGFLQTCIVDYI